MKTLYNILPKYDRLVLLVLLVSLAVSCLTSCCTQSTKNIARLERKIERKVAKAEFNGCIKLDSAKLAQYDTVTVKHDTVFIPGKTTTLRDTIQLECDSLGNVHIKYPKSNIQNPLSNIHQPISTKLTNNQIEILAECSSKDTTITILSQQAKRLNKLLDRCNTELNQERKRKRTIIPLKEKGLSHLEGVGIGFLCLLIGFIIGYIVKLIY